MTYIDDIFQTGMQKKYFNLIDDITECDYEFWHGKPRSQFRNSKVERMIYEMDDKIWVSLVFASEHKIATSNQLRMIKQMFLGDNAVTVFPFETGGDSIPDYKKMIMGKDVIAIVRKNSQPENIFTESVFMKAWIPNTMGENEDDPFIIHGDEFGNITSFGSKPKNISHDD